MAKVQPNNGGIASGFRPWSWRGNPTRDRCLGDGEEYGELAFEPELQGRLAPVPGRGVNGGEFRICPGVASREIGRDASDGYVWRFAELMKTTKYDRAEHPAAAKRDAENAGSGGGLRRLHGAIPTMRLAG